ncbi:MAG: hypothetical protein ACRDRS_25370 [Pseudonocardiaceae bacterium]
MTGGPALDTSAPTALEIRGSTPLAGTTVVDGSKNAALSLLAAAACMQQQVTLWGVPACADVEAMLSMLRLLGWAIFRHRDLPKITVGTVYEAFGDHVDSDTGSYMVRGAGAGWPGSGTVHIALPFRSRGATVAALLRAVVAARPVVIGNANLSAELRALYRALSAAGWEVQLDAQQVSLWPGRTGGRICWRAPGDKIETGTLACAIAATGGCGHVDGALVEDVAPLAEALALLGVPVR